MEDQRQWCDYSFKTYVRPLSEPIPYLIKQDTADTQRVVIRFQTGKEKGAPPRLCQELRNDVVTVRLATPAVDRRVPPIAIGVPSGGELGPGLPSLDGIDKRSGEAGERALCESLRHAGCRYIFARYNRNDGHDVAQLELYKRLADRADTGLVLELIVSGQATLLSDSIEEALHCIDTAELWHRLAVIVPMFPEHLQASQTTDYFGIEDPPPQTTPPELYDLLRAGLQRRGKKKVQVVGGAATSFVELNRRRPPATCVDGVVHSISAIVHDAADAAVVDSLQTVPAIAESVSFCFPGIKHWIAPCGIGLRGNPFGVTYALEQSASRRAMSTGDPRQNGVFGAAYTLGLMAKLVEAQPACIGLWDIIGARGMTSTESEEEDTAPLWYQATYVASRAGRGRAGRTRYYPPFHVVRGLGRARGAVVWDAVSSSPKEICSFAFHVPPQSAPRRLSGGGPGRRVSSDDDFSSPQRQFEQKRQSIGGDLQSASELTGFTGELWVANMTAEPKCVVIPLGHKASFAVALLDHSPGIQHADFDAVFLDQTLSSVILSASRDPTKMSLDLEPFAVARIVISPHTPME